MKYLTTKSDGGGRKGDFIRTRRGLLQDSGGECGKERFAA